ncbi:MAG: hypothetical protein ACK4E2_01840 [Pseudothermotoga sp.]
MDCVEIQEGFVIFTQQASTNKVNAVKLSKDLELQTVHSLEQLSFTKLNCVEKTIDTGFILAGYEILHRQSKIKIALLDERLNLIQEKILAVSGADQWVECLMKLSDGYLLVGGHRTIKGNWYQALAMKLDESLETLWSRTFGGSSDEWFSNLCQLDNGYICVGSTESYGSGQADFLVVNFSKSGRLMWWKIFGGPRWERAVGVVQTRDGIMIVGSSNSFTPHDSIFLVKINHHGQKIFQRYIDLGSDFTVKGIVNVRNKDLYIVYGELWNGYLRKDLAYLIVNNDGEVIQKKVFETYNDQSFSRLLPLRDDRFLVVANTESSSVSKGILLMLINR